MDSWMGGRYGTDEVPEITDVDNVNNHTPEEIENFRQQAEVCIPASKGKVIKHKKCIWTCTPDGHFIIDRLPNHKRTLIACGFSGHGFKFMPVIG